MEKYCSNCGNKLHENSRYCGKCGQRVKSDTNVEINKLKSNLNKTLEQTKSVIKNKNLEIKAKNIFLNDINETNYSKFISERKYKIVVIVFTLLAFVSACKLDEYNNNLSNPEAFSELEKKSNSFTAQINLEPEIDIPQNKQESIKMLSSAEETLDKYYKNISNRKMRAAYDSLTPKVQNQLGAFEEYANSYNDTIENTVRITEVLEKTKNKAKIKYTLVSKDYIPGKYNEEIHKFSGIAELILVNDKWLIDDFDVKEIK